MRLQCAEDRTEIAGRFERICGRANGRIGVRRRADMPDDGHARRLDDRYRRSVDLRRELEHHCEDEHVVLSLEKRKGPDVPALPSSAREAFTNKPALREEDLDRVEARDALDRRLDEHGSIAGI